MNFKNTVVRVSILYLVFNLLTILSHFSLVSIFSFFHFQLQHEMGIIEDWLVKNTWLILLLDKVIALFIMTYFLQSKFDIKEKFKDILKEKVNLKIVGFAIFLLVSFYALIEQFGGGINKNNVKENLLLVSYICSSFFYIVDFTFLYYFKTSFNKISRKEYLLLGFILLVLHKCTEEVILPKAQAFEVIYIIHFLTLYMFLAKKEFYSILIYCLGIIGPMSAFWGIDLVWDNSYSLYSYSRNIPILGIVGVWIIGLVYLYSNKKLRLGVWPFRKE